MKTIFKVEIIFFSILSIVSCKKEKEYIGFSTTYFIFNNTNDTFNIKVDDGTIPGEYSGVWPTWSYTFLPNDSFVVGSTNSGCNFKYFMVKFYKNNDTTLYFMFDKGIVYNYKVNFFNIHNWQKTKGCKVGKDSYSPYIYYTFEIKTENIINP